MFSLYIYTLNTRNDHWGLSLCSLQVTCVCRRWWGWCVRREEPSSLPQMNGKPVSPHGALHLIYTKITSLLNHTHEPQCLCPSVETLFNSPYTICNIFVWGLIIRTIILLSGVTLYSVTQTPLPWTHQHSDTGHTLQPDVWMVGVLWCCEYWSSFLRGEIWKETVILFLKQLTKYKHPRRQNEKFQHINISIYAVVFSFCHIPSLPSS